MQCHNCGTQVGSTEEVCPSCDAPLAVPRPPRWRQVGFVAFFSLIIALLIVGGVAFVTWVTVADDLNVEKIELGEAVSGTMGPESVMGMADKPYRDYEVRIPAYGAYEIVLQSDQPEVFDPYVSLLSQNQMIAVDGDSGMGNDARIVQNLRAGTYIVRTTRTAIGAMETPVGYTLSVRPIEAR
jgi:hypothetical protein